MEVIKNLDSVSQFNSERGQATLHPLVTVLDQSKSKEIKAELFNSGLYIVFLKNVKCAELKYGRNHYDYQEDTLIFLAPGQIAGFEEEGELIQPNGWVLAFHPDLIKGTHLCSIIKNYSFSYNANEALHTSEKEKQLVVECFQKILFELENAIDKHSKKLIASNIELLLNYCERFFDRQFITRDLINKDVLNRFETLLDVYFKADNLQTIGLPTVGYCAAEMNLSANYFGDLIKKETGKTAQEYIQGKVLDLAKIKVMDMSKSISEIAYELGYKYPSHFTRLFKQKTGKSPIEYRHLN